MTASTWNRYLLPAFTFMSVVIGGGYATGRELVQFFMSAGPAGGLLGMLVCAALWSGTFALSLELARATGSFDYRVFFKQLLGRGWVLFDISYLALLLLVLAVLGAACGEIAMDIVGTPAWTGALAFMALVALLAWAGTTAIEAFLSAWGLVLIVAYVVFMLVCLYTFGERIDASFASSEVPRSGWLRGGVMYAGYNIAVLRALLFCARHQRCRREALIAGALAGPIAILPGVAFYVAMLARYPEILDAAIPLQLLLQALEAPWLAIAMQVAIFGTLVQTGVGVLHGFNERLLGARADSDAASARLQRLAVTLLLSATAILLATRIGLIDLIATGYGYLAWVMIAIYLLPLVTVGLWRVIRESDR